MIEHLEQLRSDARKDNRPLLHHKRWHRLRSQRREVLLEMEVELCADISSKGSARNRRVMALSRVSQLQV